MDISRQLQATCDIKLCAYVDGVSSVVRKSSKET